MEVLYEDKYLVVINKPAGILSVPYPGSRGRTVLDIITENRRKRGLIRGNNKPFAVHRLDKETSGVMMFALTMEARNKIMDSWQKMVTSRCYRALAENPVSKVQLLPESGVIDAPLTKNAYHHSYVKKNSPRKNGERENGKNDYKNNDKNEVSAITHYSVIGRGDKYTLFELELETGRTNQIRAHLASCGYPLVGDQLFHAKTDPFRRLCLHAVSLEFEHPYTKEVLNFKVSEPEAWSKMIKSVVKNNSQVVCNN